MPGHGLRVALVQAQQIPPDRGIEIGGLDLIGQIRLVRSRRPAIDPASATFTTAPTRSPALPAAAGEVRRVFAAAPGRLDTVPARPIRAAVGPIRRTAPTGATVGPIARTPPAETTVVRATIPSFRRTASADTAIIGTGTTIRASDAAPMIPASIGIAGGRAALGPEISALPRSVIPLIAFRA